MPDAAVSTAMEVLALPSYITSPLISGGPPVPSLLPGVPSFSFGSQDSHNPGCRMSVQSVAIASNVATVAVTVLEGYIPVVTSKVSAPTITISGTQTTTSGGAPNFNVTNVALASVSINSTTGIGTITFALTSSNITTTTDSGMAYSPTPIKFETTAPVSTTAGLQFAIGRPFGVYQGLAIIGVEIAFSGAPGTFEFDVQEAMTDDGTGNTYTLVSGGSIIAVNTTGQLATLDLQTAANFVRGYLKTLTNAVSMYAKFVLQ